MGLNQANPYRLHRMLWLASQLGGKITITQTIVNAYISGFIYLAELFATTKFTLDDVHPAFFVIKTPKSQLEDTLRTGIP